jgi:hypothetical protein
MLLALWRNRDALQRNPDTVVSSACCVGERLVRAIVLP